MIKENVKVCIELLRENLDDINKDYKALDPRSVATAKTKLDEFELWINKAFDSEGKLNFKRNG